MTLTELLDEYEDWKDMDGCSCHINPPCSFCVHPGNPAGFDVYTVIDSEENKSSLTTHEDHLCLSSGIGLCYVDFLDETALKHYRLIS